MILLQEDIGAIVHVHLTDIGCTAAAQALIESDTFLANMEDFTGADIQTALTDAYLTTMRQHIEANAPGESIAS